jgi:hypothetical protein
MRLCVREQCCKRRIVVCDEKGPPSSAAGGQSANPSSPPRSAMSTRHALSSCRLIQFALQRRQVARSEAKFLLISSRDSSLQLHAAARCQWQCRSFSDTPPSPPPPSKTPEPLLPTLNPSALNSSASSTALDLLPTTFLVSTGITITSLASLTAVTATGVDLNLFVQWLAQYSSALDGLQFDPVGGRIALVIAAHAAIAPARYALAAALAPFALPWYRRAVKPHWTRFRGIYSDAAKPLSPPPPSAPPI